MAITRLALIFSVVCLGTFFIFIGDVLVPSKADQAEINTSSSPVVESKPVILPASFDEPIERRESSNSDVLAATQVGGIMLPDPKWPTGGVNDISWPLVKGFMTPSTLSKSDLERDSSQAISSNWRGIIPRKFEQINNTTVDDSYPASIMYFYDDIANHSVFLLQTTLNIVEPSVPQVSMYVEPILKKPEWSFTVKLDFILKSIKAYWGKVIVVIDTDMIFYRPWAASVAKVMQHNDLAFQGVDTYSPSNPSEFKKLRKTVVFAISTIRCNEKTEKFFQKIKSKISCNNAWVKGRYDQEELIAQLGSQEHSKLKWTVLPREFWGPSMSRSRCKMPPQPIMCHPDMKKSKQGGQWMIWHRKTEWKFHHILSQHCMGRYLIDKSEKGDWWHPYSLLAGVSGLITPFAGPVHEKTDVVVFSDFFPDDWSRFTLLTTLRLHEPDLNVQLVNVSYSEAYVTSVLSTRPVGKIMYFMTSTSVVFKPFTSVIKKYFFENPKMSRASLDGDRFVAARSGTGSSMQLPKKEFHLSGGGNATTDALLCVSNTLISLHFPFWSTPRGVQGYLTLDERHFFTLAYTRCGYPYSVCDC